MQMLARKAIGQYTINYKMGDVRGQRSGRVQATCLAALRMLPKRRLRAQSFLPSLSFLLFTLFVQQPPHTPSNTVQWHSAHSSHLEAM